jgi:hypothetical protein
VVEPDPAHARTVEERTHQQGIILVAREIIREAGLAVETGSTQFRVRHSDARLCAEHDAGGQGFRAGACQPVGEGVARPRPALA